MDKLEIIEQKIHELHELVQNQEDYELIVLGLGKKGKTTSIHHVQSASFTGAYRLLLMGLISHLGSPKPPREESILNTIDNRQLKFLMYQAFEVMKEIDPIDEEVIEEFSKSLHLSVIGTVFESFAACKRIPSKEKTSAFMQKILESLPLEEKLLTKFAHANAAFENLYKTEES